MGPSYTVERPQWAGSTGPIRPFNRPLSQRPFDWPVERVFKTPIHISLLHQATSLLQQATGLLQHATSLLHQATSLRVFKTPIHALSFSGPFDRPFNPRPFNDGSRGLCERLCETECLCERLCETVQKR